MNLKKFSIVGNLQNDLPHVVGRIRVIRNDLVQHCRWPVDRIMARHSWRILAIGQRQIRHQRARLHQHFNIIGKRTMRHTRGATVHFCPAQLFSRQIFMRDRLYHIRPGNKHVARTLNHKNEIGNGRRIDSSTGAWAHDQ